MKYYLYILLFLMTFIIVVHDVNDPGLNELRCQVSEFALKGIITSEKGRSGYVHLTLDNYKTPFLLTIDDLLYSEFKSKNYLYGIGDSLIKKANSDTLIIVHNQKKAIMTIACKRGRFSW